MVRALLLGVACLAATACAAQGAPTDCPQSAADLPLEALYGHWEARIDGQAGVARIELSKHPDYAGVQGRIVRPGANGAPDRVARLAGDIDDEGQLGIDESEDGHAISGVWSAQLEPGSCGRELRGTWRNAADDSTHAVLLRKTDH